MTAQEAARRIADLFWELEDEGIEVGGHWSGDLLIGKKGGNCAEASLGFGDDSSQAGGDWHYIFPRQQDEFKNRLAGLMKTEKEVLDRLADM